MLRRSLSLGSSRTALMRGRCRPLFLDVIEAPKRSARLLATRMDCTGSIGDAIGPNVV